MKNNKPSYVSGSAVRKDKELKEKKAKEMNFRDWKKMMESNRGCYR